MTGTRFADTGEAAPMTPDLVEALAGLRDLQFENAEGDGLWLPVVAGILLALLAISAIRWWLSSRQVALRQLRRLRGAYRQARATRIGQADLVFWHVAAISALLREEAVRGRSPPMPPGLSDIDFLRWLDERAPASDRGKFTNGVGRALVRLPFVRCGSEGDADDAGIDDLFALSARWLRHAR